MVTKKMKFTESNLSVVALYLDLLPQRERRGEISADCLSISVINARLGEVDELKDSQRSLNGVSSKMNEINIFISLLSYVIADSVACDERDSIVNP